MPEKRENFSLSDALSSLMTPQLWSYLLFSLLPLFLFNYGAAKMAYGQTQSYFISVLAFFFSGFYYAYYAWFVYTPPAAVGTILGAARRLRR